MKKKVLIIDSDLNICKEIAESLQNEATEAIYALSAPDAMEKLTRQHFCLVIMGIQLSETDGMRLLKIIREIKPIPILILSSTASSAERIAALKAGAHGYLEKPYQLEECLAHAQSRWSGTEPRTVIQRSLG